MEMTLPPDFTPAPACGDVMPPGDAAANELRQVAVPAQLLRYKHGHCVALPVHVAIEVLDDPVIVDVPGASYYCRQLVRWRSQWLPLLDLDTLLRAYLPANGGGQPRYVLVVGYQPAVDAPVMYGAIGLPALPQVISVTDAMQCDLPNNSDLWPILARACFRYNGQPVPVVDTARLFCAYLD